LFGTCCEAGSLLLAEVVSCSNCGRHGGVKVAYMTIYNCFVLMSFHSMLGFPLW